MTSMTTPELATTHVTVYQLRYGSIVKPDVIATYATMQAAQEHAEYARRTVRPADTLAWYPEGADDDSPLRLYATSPAGVETATYWHIVPGMVRTSFTPVCGES